MSLPNVDSDPRQTTTSGKPDPSSTEFDDFIYLISHDFRSSVRALIELPQWIEEDLAEAGVKVDGSIAESVELMNKHTGRLDRMLVDLLTFSRVGRMQEVCEIDLNDALDEVLDEIHIPHGFSVKKDLAHTTVAFGDRDILTLLAALISNGIKHHDQEQGSVLVTSHVNKNQFVLQVSDDGPGIPKHFQERVFGAMTTLRPRDEVEGSGMGLAISRRIGQRYDGTIEIITAPNARGTTIEICLPLK